MTDEVYTLPPGPPPANHGHTQAAWLMTGGVLLGFLIAGIGVGIAHTALIVSGLVVLALAIAISLVMRATGRGQPVPSRSRAWYED